MSRRHSHSVPCVQSTSRRSIWLHRRFIHSTLLTKHRTSMPKTCCVTACDVGKRTCLIKASLFRLPSDPIEKERWKRAIPREETGSFKFDSPNTRVCALHFDPSDIIRTDNFIVNQELVSHDRIVPKLRAGAVPRIFPNCPSYLTTPKPRSRVRKTRLPDPRPAACKPATTTKRKQSACASHENRDEATPGPPPKILRLSSKENVDPDIRSDQAAWNGDDEGLHTYEKCCQTDDGGVCTKTELLRVKGKLWQAQNAIRSLQRRLAQKVKECRTSHVLREEHPKEEKLPGRQRLILDQCLKKLAAKSAKGMR